MQQFFACIMLCCLAFECAGIRIIQAIDLYSTKDRMQEWVEEAFLHPHHARSTEIIRFSDYDFARTEWHDEGKEFRRNGIMYDIVRLWREGDSIVIECFRDDRETKILNDMAKEEKQHDNATQSSDGTSFLAKTFAKYLRPPSTREITRPPIPIFFIGYMFHKFKSNSLEVPTPPPRSV